MQVSTTYLDCVKVAKSGSTRYQYFRVLSTNISYPVLELATDVVGWEPGKLYRI